MTPATGNARIGIPHPPPRRLPDGQGVCVCACVWCVCVWGGMRLGGSSAARREQAPQRCGAAVRCLGGRRLRLARLRLDTPHASCGCMTTVFKLRDHRLTASMQHAARSRSHRRATLRQGRARGWRQRLPGPAPDAGADWRRVAGVGDLQEQRGRREGREGGGCGRGALRRRDGRGARAEALGAGAPQLADAARRPRGMRRHATVACR